MSTLLVIGVGGALGALARYGVDVSVTRRIGFVPDAFPWGTLAINVAGSFVFGLLFVILVEPAYGPAWVRTGLTTGFLSAFTTFSTFSVQVVSLTERGRGGLALAYLLASVVLGVFAAGAAILASRISPWFGWGTGGLVTALFVIAITRPT